MPKKRIYQVAKEFRISSEALISMLEKLGYECTSHMNAIEDEAVEKVRAEFEKEKAAVKREYAKKVKKAVRERRSKSTAATKKAGGAGKKAAAKPSKAKTTRTTKKAKAAKEAPEKAGAKAKKKTPKVVAPSKRAERKPADRAKAGAPAAAATEAPKLKERPKPQAEQRRRKKRKPRVDQKTVEDTVRRTLAGRDSRRTGHRRLRDGHGSAAHLRPSRGGRAAVGSGPGRVRHLAIDRGRARRTIAAGDLPVLRRP